MRDRRQTGNVVASLLRHPPHRASHLALAFALVCTMVPVRRGRAADSTVVYFRSDHGIAAAPGRLPSRLGEPGVRQWRAAIDPGHSTPVLTRDRIILTTFNPGAKELAVVALDEKTGSQLWRRPLTPTRIEQTHAIGSPATATPAFDGARVFTFFGSYGLVCHDLEGNRLWEHRMGPFQDEYGAGSSPVLIGNNLILNQDHDADSFLAAFDRVTGSLVWKTSRPDSVRSYSTPAVWSRDGTRELLVAGALELAGYDPSTGGKLWAIPGLARIVIPTPVPAGDRIYVASWSPGGDSGRRITLVDWPVAVGKWDRNQDRQLAKDEIDDPEVLDRYFRMDLDQNGRLDEKEWTRHADVFRRAQNAALAIRPSGRGAQGDEAVLWKYPRGVPYVASPLVHGGAFWMVKDGGIVTQLDAENGQLRFEERLPGPGSYYASPVTGDGKVYFASEPGVVSVVASTGPWSVVSSHDFAEKIYATPVLHAGRIWVRTEKGLYCFEGGRD